MSVTPLAMFVRTTVSLVKFNAAFQLIRSEDHTIYTLEIQGSELRKLWSKVKCTYDKCLDYLTTLAGVKTEDIDEADEKYEASYQAFVKCLSAINQKLDQLKAAAKSSPSLGQSVLAASTPRGPPTQDQISDHESIASSSNRSVGVSNVSQPTVASSAVENLTHNMNLPPCDTDIFHGDFLSWPTFRDLFTAIYINNTRLSDIERLCHLVRKTGGDARDIVAKYPLTHRSFALAWKSLKDAYDNKRILVNSHLKILFDLPILENETSSGLKSLQRGINGCLSAMAVYDIPTDHWDPILVFICIQRLPKLTLTLWEQGIRDKSSLSTWNDLDSFLTERIQTLACLRDIKGSDSSNVSNSRKVRTHFTKASPSGNAKTSCIFCPKEDHPLIACPRFKKLNFDRKFSEVKKQGRCLNCLSRGHVVKDCPSTRNCNVCNGRHHTLLHRPDRSSPATASDTDLRSPCTSPPPDTDLDNVASTSNGAKPATMNRQVFHTSQHRMVLLGTAMVNIIHQGTSYPVRALIDPASEASFITEHLQNRLKLSAHSVLARVSGVNGSVSATSRKNCSLCIGSLLDSSILLKTVAFVLRQISGNLPSFNVRSGLALRLPNLQLADAHLFDGRPVDLLLGADLYPQILLQGTRQNIIGSLLAQNTIFGWIITGPIPSSPVQVFSTKLEFCEEDSLNKTLLRFWELEETPKRKILSPSDKFCEDNYRSTTTRNAEGRYVVTLPFRSEYPQTLTLGDSRKNVLLQFYRHENSLCRKPEIKIVYDNVVQEYLQLDHMRPISYLPTDTRVCYLPHHPVINPDKQTSKLRVVFNASNKTSNGISLNDILHVGPTLQADLVLLILRWRLFRYVFNCDITQMYRQIRVDPKHTPFQRIMFRKSPSDPVQDYELQTVTFGVNCAPFLALRTLLQLADDTEAELPLAAHILRKCMYVDDVLAGFHDLDTALVARDQLVSALGTAKFELRKWTSNHSSILSSIPTDHLVDAQVLSFVEFSSSKPLGIRWNAQLDSFYFCVDSIPTKSNYTKREVLSTIAKLFDPVGWLAPVIVVAKIIMQKVWLDNINWDDSLPELTKDAWQTFVDKYIAVNSIRIPRWVRSYPDSLAELHVFSDASEKAYAGVIYIRTQTPLGEVCVHLLSSKTRVAPLKSISLPRLELCGAVLASELLKAVLSEIGIAIHKIYCWTDSTIVQAWLRKTPSTWSAFVANRVCRIQQNVGNCMWYHVRSEDNPADLGSRGVSPTELENSSLWWQGPDWLRLEPSQWKMSNLNPLDTDLEARVVRSHVSFFSAYDEVLDRFSSLDRALRVLSYVFRFFHRTHPVHRTRYTFVNVTVTSVEIKAIKQRLAIIAQKVYYAEDYKCLMDRTRLPSSSALLSLNPYLDADGVIRLNGRLVKSPSLSYKEKHPIVLPYASRFTLLLVNYMHLLTIHGGNQLMIRVMRTEYWVPRLTTLIRAVIHRCKPCVLERKRSCSQIMAALPPERTVVTRAFTTTGVDFAGPFEIKSFTGRACRITKGYVCVFVCFSTKAIHLEPTSNLSSDTFLAAFQRFIARRGCPQTLFSDNGTNFVGASREIEKNFKVFLRESRETVCSYMGYQELTWQFIPAGAPHMGGLWEAAVKSFKLQFRRHARDLKYTFEEFSTVLARIEACLNSRPLCPMSDNADDMVALTPGHLLIGAPLLAPPEPIIEESPLSLVNRYRKVKALTHQFCIRWKEEYLHSLNKRYKWKYPQRNLQKDDLVVIRHEQLPPTSWRLGRVIQIHPGDDGNVRVVDIRTGQGVVRRPVSKLVILPN